MTKFRKSALFGMAALAATASPAFARHSAVKHNSAADDVGNIFSFASLFFGAVNTAHALKPIIVTAAAFGKHAPKQPRP